MSVAAEFKSEAGISFQYPDDWTALTELNREQLNPEVQAYLQESQIDLRAIHVMVIRLNQSDFQENFNFQIIPHEVPITDSSIKNILPQVMSQHATAGIQTSEISGDLTSVAGRRGINLTWKAILPFEDRQLRQRQVLVPGGGQTFVITFTALPSTYDKYVRDFEAVLQSLQLPPQQSGLNWDALGCIVGVIIGVPIGIIVMRLAKKKWGRPSPPNV